MINSENFYKFFLYFCLITTFLFLLAVGLMSKYEKNQPCAYFKDNTAFPARCTYYFNNQ